MILISSCLAGINCNYKGKSKLNKRVIELLKEGKAVLVCPEQLGGLPTPRNGARILSGEGKDVLEGRTRVVTDKNEDVTQQYIKGAKETLKIAKLVNASLAILKEGSPSCGSNFTQGGIKIRKEVKGEGVTTALLRKNGIKVISENELKELDSQPDSD